VPYFDAASAAPLHPVARQALLAALDEGWADPARLYREGRRARMLLDAARQAAAEAVGCRPDTALACVQSAGHETGTCQPVAEIAQVCRAAGVPLMVDAAQSLAWGPVAGDWSLLAGSAHKWGGPPGVGLLAVRKGTRYAAQEPADERESGRSPGFENLPAIVAAAASLRAVREQAAGEAARLSELVDRIRTRVPSLVPDVEVVGHPRLRLPHIVTFSCLYVDGEALLAALDRAGFSVSSGSSCTSSTLTPSHVLKAMGVLSEGNVRVSLPPGTAEQDVERFLALLPGVVAEVRAQAGAGPAVTRPAGAAGTGAVGTEPVGTDAGPASAEQAGTEPAGGGPAGTDAGPANADAAADAAVAEPGTGLVVDSLGKRCPIPVIDLARVIGDVPVGGLVTVLSDDEAARLDIPAWCQMRGQEYVGERPAERGAAYVVRRRA
jgi:cysteine desulfurase